MNVTFEFHAQLRLHATVASIVAELPAGATLSAGLAQVAATQSDSFQRIVFASAGQLSPAMLVTRNGAMIPHRECSSMMLQAGDRVVLLPAIAGG